MTLSPNDRMLDGLVESAHRAMHAGREDEAARLWQQVLQAAPGHAHALLFFGQRTLRQGDPKGALEILRQAIVANPKDPMLRVAVASARKLAGDTDGEMTALEDALKLEPYCLPALLLKGKLLQKLGKNRKAVLIYQNALKLVSNQDRLPADLREVVVAARQLISENSANLVGILHEQLRDIGALSELSERLRMCVEVAAGRKKVFTVDPVGGPHVPELPAIQFFDPAQFAWLKEVESQTGTILAELRTLLEQEAQDFKPYVRHPQGVPLNQWAELNHSPRWGAYFLLKDGVRQDLHCDRCPRTAEILQTLPLADIPRAAPTAFFSVLEPHTRIPPHTGVTNARVIVHLPLIVPSNCGFRVGNETREWQVGKALVFDDTIEHEAWNESDKTRVVLIFDVWNPYLTAAERDAVRLLTSALRDYYEAEP